jgi:eukaryotic translation initiation factor 2C
MAAIPPMDLPAAKVALPDDFRRKIDADLKYEKCIWCTTGSGKGKKGKAHSLLNCPNARPAPNLRTALSNEVFNAGQEDVAVAYIHGLQLKEYPREDGKTPFSTGRLRYLLNTFTASTASEPVDKTVEKTNPTLRTDQPGSTISAPNTATETAPTTKGVTGIAPPQTPAPLPIRASTATLPVSIASPSPVSPAQVPVVTATNIIYQDENVPMAPQRSAPTARDLRKTANIIMARGDTVQKLGALRNLNMDFPAREGFINATSMVYTNHFQIKLRSDQQLYRYNIETSMTGKNKRKMKALVKTAIQTYGFLSNNTANFATDYFETIISWAPLHPLVGNQYKLVNGNGQGIGSSWQLPELQDDGLALRVNITFDSMVDIDSFLRHTNIDPNHATTDLEPTKRALNILVSKCFGEATTNMIQTGANKFFCKGGSASLTDNNRSISRSLCTLRGYYYTIKAGIREVLLNINTGTSAFYQPILVSELMLDHNTFYDRELEQALKGVRVHIEYERGDKQKDAATWDRLNSTRARVKTIQGLGLSVRKQVFKDENDKVHTVKNHLEHSKSYLPQS